MSGATTALTVAALGLGGVSAVKSLTKKSPKVSSSSAQATQEEQRKAQEEQRKAQTSRAALYETSGGVTGAELDPNQVKRRNTLLGN